MYRCSLCISFSSLTTLLHQLATQSLERAAHIACDPHILCWDNINIKTLIFVKQRDSAPAKVQSGTFAILYQINANPVDMQLSPMLACAQWATDLAFISNVRPTSDQCKAFNSQLCVHIINILFDFAKSFEEFTHPDDPCLIHADHCKMPNGHCTKQFPLRTSTIDKSSILGNITVVNDVYTNQLKLSPEQLLIAWFQASTINQPMLVFVVPRLCEQRTSIPSLAFNAYNSVSGYSTCA